MPERYQFVFKKKDLPNTELRYINQGTGNIPFVVNHLKTQKVDIYLNKNALDYFFKTTLLLFCLCACLWEPMCTCFVFLHATQARDAGLFEKASGEAQRSSPPAFMLGCRREQNTEGLEERAGCSQECGGLAKLAAQL